MNITITKLSGLYKQGSHSEIVEVEIKNYVKIEIPQKVYRALIGHYPDTIIAFLQNYVGPSINYAPVEMLQGIAHRVNRGDYEVNEITVLADTDAKRTIQLSLAEAQLLQELVTAEPMYRRIISAIKYLRREYNLSLLEAKLIVDKLQELGSGYF